MHLVFLNYVFFSSQTDKRGRGKKGRKRRKSNSGGILGQNPPS